MSDAHVHVADAALAMGAKTTATLTHGGAAAAMWGGYTANEVAMAIGIAASLIGLVGNLVINWYWKSKAYQLKVDRLEHDRRQCDQPIDCDRRKQGGAINRTLVSVMSAGSLAAALAGYVALYEGDGPTSIEPVTGEILHHAYPDPAHGWSVPTICQGRTRGVVPGMVATAGQCRLWLESELRDEVIRSLARNVKVPVTLNQAVALGLFRDNVGEGNFQSSKLLRDLNAGRCDAAATEFNASPQIDRATGRPRLWTGRRIIDRSTGAVLQDTGAPIMKWTTGAGIPLPGLIKRRGEERALFEPDCAAWRG